MTVSDPDPAPGVLLIAPPTMGDPNFRRTVVLLCEHSPEGSFGLILNRTLSLELCTVIEEIDSDAPISLGGPVQQNTLHFIHRHEMEDAIPILDGVYWGGDFELLKSLVRYDELPLNKVRFFLGYAGWSPGQLEEEIEEGGWFTAHADAAFIFNVDPDRLWRTVMREMGGEYALLSNFPEDPRMN